MKNKRQVDPSVYDKDYYEDHSQGFSRMLEKVKPFLQVKKNDVVLDLGCGKGDWSFYLARKANKVVGVDYSKDAIELANKSKNNHPKKLRKKVEFKLMDATKIKKLGEDRFDLIVSIDVFEHINKNDLEKVMKGLNHVLKKNGRLVVHTEVNKIYLDFTHRFWIYPMSKLLITINKLVTGKGYPGLSKDPRPEVHKKQHVNEPTYFYLRELFERHGFKGEIHQLNSLLKPILSWKDFLYNVLVLWYPLSNYKPFSYLFSYDYICVMKNRK